jgi:hypothetical protein
MARDHILSREPELAPPAGARVGGAGVSAEVLSGPNGDDEIGIIVPAWDQGIRDWGPVPYILGGTGVRDPENGDDAFLHVDSDGQPAYAVVWVV